MTTTETYKPNVPANRRSRYALSLAALRSEPDSQVNSRASVFSRNYSANLLCSTAGIYEQEWLGWRTKGIGGSDAATVLGANPYKTKRELYYEKRGIQPVKAKDEDTLPLR